ncbi:MAG: purine-nucleoside phosphorylase [Bacteroidales bacterium]
MLKKIQETADFIKDQTNFEPEVGIVLGTGLGGLVEEIEIEKTLEYTDIPNFPVSTVSGHKGCLLFGNLNGRKIVAMQGRFHFYEGYSMQELVFQIRVMRFLGIQMLVVSNACGGMNPAFNVGDVMIIRDHINLLPGNPLIGKNIDELGPRFPDMGEAYSRKLIQLAEKYANDQGILYQKGVYASVTGPTFETPAEYKYIHIIGADAVGMSTVPEVIAARHMGVPVFGMSVITDLGVDGVVEEVSHEEVIKAAKTAEPKMSAMISAVVKGFDQVL